MISFAEKLSAYIPIEYEDNLTQNNTNYQIPVFHESSFPFL